MHAGKSLTLARSPKFDEQYSTDEWKAADTFICFLPGRNSNFRSKTVLYRSHNSFAHRFSGSIGIGYSYTRSSNFGRLNYDGKLNYRAKNEELSLSVSGLYDMTDTSFSKNREDVFIKNNYYLTPTWFLTATLGYQRNLELSLLRRYQEGFGAGNKFITSRHVYAWTRGGLVLNQEKSTEEVSSSTQAEIFGQVEVNFFRFYKTESQRSHDAGNLLQSLAKREIPQRWGNQR